MAHLVEFWVPYSPPCQIGFHLLGVPLVWMIVLFHFLWGEVLCVAIQVFDSIVLVGGIIVCYLPLIVFLVGESFSDKGSYIIHLV